MQTIQPADVLVMLTEYRDNVGKCAHLEVTITRLETLLAQQRALLEDTASLHAQQISGMPHGSGTGDPVGRLACSLASGDTPSYIAELESDICRLKTERELYGSRVRYVEAWLKILPEQERYVLEEHTVNGVSWRMLGFEFERRFKTSGAKSTLKRVHARALERIYRLLEM